MKLSLRAQRGNLPTCDSPARRLFASLTPSGPPCGRSTLASSLVPRCARNDGLTRLLGRLSVLLLVSLPPISAQAQDQVWLIGGGYNLDNAQVQIEQNVLWAREVLQALPGKRSVHTYFNDGNDPAPDVMLWLQPADNAASLQPLARIYDAYYANGESTRSNVITALEGAATRATVMEMLPQAMQDLAPGEQGLFVYAGHGSPGEHGSQLDLWGDAHLSAPELRTLLKAQPSQTTLRLIFTQCFAAGFQAVVMPQVTGAHRCGFYAVAQDQLAEGCTASLDVAEYRGYGTYFFAALAGQARTGTPLQSEPDRNHDGRVDPYEAHLYSLRAARSTDVPRSSSEQYLLDWAPWYAPLLRSKPVADNPYAEIAQALIGELDITEPVRDTLYTRRQQAQQQINKLLTIQQQTLDRAQTTMYALQDAFELRWPAAGSPYTLAYKHFIERDLEPAQAFIQAHPLYPALVLDQDAYWSQEDAILALLRQVALYDRIEHRQKLARLRDVFLAHADVAERGLYQDLLGCEQLPL